jgi:hypothetical protein
MCADCDRRVCASSFVYAGRRVVGPHGSTPADRLALSDVGVNCAKVTEAGFPHRGKPGLLLSNISYGGQPRRGQPRPRKPRCGFGRRVSKVQRWPRRRPTYSLKGSVPGVPAHVSVWLCTDLSGGGVSQPRVRPEDVVGPGPSWCHFVRAFDRSGLLVDFAQAHVSTLGHMVSQIVQKCSVCGEDKGSDCCCCRNQDS